jgi:hypothetical protein
MLLHNRHLAYLWLLPLTWVVLACQGQNLAHTAQRGSTIAISLGGNWSTGAFAPNVLVVGYGGTAFTDYQRGEMVYKLDGFGGPELITRATTTLIAHPASSSARDGLDLFTLSSGQQHVSIVDIPSDAPLGTHSLYVVRRVSGSSDIQVGEHPAKIQILDSSYSVEGPGGPEEIAGTSTDFASWTCNFTDCYWGDQTGNIPAVIPDPQLRMRLSSAVHAVKLQVSYPPQVIDVLDAIQSSTSLDTYLTGDHATVWFEDDGSGSVTIQAAADGQPFNAVSLVFGLDDGASQILDPASVVATVTAAYDEDGNPLSGVTVNQKKIR